MTNNERAQNCWEYFNCPKEVKEKCSAYQMNSGKECWMLAGSFSPKEMKCPKVTHKYKYCWECPWFKKLNPDFDKKQK